MTKEMYRCGMWLEGLRKDTKYLGPWAVMIPTSLQVGDTLWSCNQYS
jgi:hypothetical protein